MAKSRNFLNRFGWDCGYLSVTALYKDQAIGVLLSSEGEAHCRRCIGDDGDKFVGQSAQLGLERHFLRSSFHCPPQETSLMTYMPYLSKVTRRRIMYALCKGLLSIRRDALCRGTRLCDGFLLRCAYPLLTALTRRDGPSLIDMMEFPLTFGTPTSTGVPRLELYKAWPWQAICMQPSLFLPITWNYARGLPMVAPFSCLNPKQTLVAKFGYRYCQTLRLDPSTPIAGEPQPPSTRSHLRLDDLEVMLR